MVPVDVATKACSLNPPSLQAQEMAERAAALERARLDPFSSANRASNADPFLMAGDMLKFPTVPFVPGEPQDQVRPGRTLLGLDGSAGVLTRDAARSSPCRTSVLRLQCPRSRSNLYA